MPTLPIPRIVWPIVIDSTNDSLSFKVTTTSLNLEKIYSTSISTATYATPEDFAVALASALAAAYRTGPVKTFSTDDGGSATVAISSDGRASITLGGLANSSGATIRWALNSDSTALAGLLGFEAVDDVVTVSSNSATFTGDHQMRHFWTPGVPVVSDDVEAQLATRTLSRTATGSSKTLSWSQLEERTIEFGYLTAAKTFTEREGSASNGALQRFWESSGVGKFTYSPDRTSPTTGDADYFLLDDTLREFKPVRDAPGIELYSFTLRMGAYVS